MVIEDHELTSDHLKEECTKCMESVESKFCNIKQPLYEGIRLDNIFYLEFDDNPDVNNMVLPYGQEIKDQNK